MWMILVQGCIRMDAKPCDFYMRERELNIREVQIDYFDGLLVLELDSAGTVRLSSQSLKRMREHFATKKVHNQRTALFLVKDCLNTYY